MTAQPHRPAIRAARRVWPASRSAGWPAPPDPAAFDGLAGEIVTAIAPHTEADPVAILAQLLVAFGAAVGRGAWFAVEATRHHPNEFLVLVGDSAKPARAPSLGPHRRAARHRRSGAGGAHHHRPVLRRRTDLGSPRPHRSRIPASRDRRLLDRRARVRQRAQAIRPRPSQRSPRRCAPPGTAAPSRCSPAPRPPPRPTRTSPSSATSPPPSCATTPAPSSSPTAS